MSRHADLPVGNVDPYEVKSLTPTKETTAWQNAHEPLLAIRVWLGANGEVLTNASWEREVRDADVMCKPLEDMARAVLGVNEAVAAITAALQVTYLQREMLADLKVQG